MNRISRELLSIAREINKIASKIVIADYDVSKNHFYDERIQKKKNELIKSFNELYNNTSPTFGDNDFYIYAIYEILTNLTKNISEFQWLNDDLKKWYNSSIERMNPYAIVSGWANFRPDLSYEEIKKLKGNSSNTYNRYYTFELKNAQDIKNFVSFINDIVLHLKNSLQSIKNKKHPYFQFKTFDNIIELLTHNDTFKVFYYNHKDKIEVTKIIEKYINKNHLKETNRAYYYGKDVKVSDDVLMKILDLPLQKFNKLNAMHGSFGQRLAKNISLLVLEDIKNFKNNKNNQKNNFNFGEFYYPYFKQKFGERVQVLLQKLL